MLQRRVVMLHTFAISCILGLSPLQAAEPAEVVELSLGTHSPGARFTTAIAAHNVSCKGRHDFQLVLRDASWLTWPGSSDLKGIRKGKKKSTKVVVDTAGLPPGTHRGVVEVQCITCPPPPKCFQDRTAVELVLSIRATQHVDTDGRLGGPGSPNETELQFNRNQRGFVARYRSEGREVVTEMVRERDHSIVRVDIPTIGNLLELTVPPVASFSMVDEPDRVSRLTLGPGFRGVQLEEQTKLLVLLSQSTAVLVPKLVGEEDDVTIHMIEAIPHFVGMQLEQDDMEKIDQIIMVGLNDGKCHGACGPGCSWCFCRSLLCACEVNDFCYWHDSCCGAWLEFFNCRPSSLCDWDEWPAVPIF